MKKITLSILIIFVGLNVLAQKNLTWVNVGLRGGYGTSVFLNKPSMDDSNVEYNYYSPSFFVEGRLGVMFGDYVGVSGGFGKCFYSADYKLHTTMANFDRKLSMDAMSFVLQLNVDIPGGFFIDIGPRFQKTGSAKITNSEYNSRAEIDLKPMLEKQFISADFAFGITTFFTDYLTLKTGVRGNYSIINIVSQSGYILPTGGNMYYVPAYTDEKTNLAQLTLSAELTYTFGRFGKASCGKNRFMFN